MTRKSLSLQQSLAGIYIEDDRKYRLQCIILNIISGEFDYLVKARLKEMSAYRRLLGDLLKKLPSSASSHSYIVMEEVKETLYLDLS